MKERKQTIETKPINAVIYARVSSAGDRQSTDRQVKELTDYAVYKKYNVVNVYTEHISGAKKNGERPVLREAIDCCKEYAQPLASEGNARIVSFSLSANCPDLDVMPLKYWKPLRS